MMKIAKFILIIHNNLVVHAQGKDFRFKTNKYFKSDSHKV